MGVDDPGYFPLVVYYALFINYRDSQKPGFFEKPGFSDTVGWVTAKKLMKPTVKLSVVTHPTTYLLMTETKNPTGNGLNLGEIIKPMPRVKRIDNLNAPKVNPSVSKAKTPLVTD